MLIKGQHPFWVGAEGGRQSRDELSSDASEICLVVPKMPKSESPEQK